MCCIVLSFDSIFVYVGISGILTSGGVYKRLLSDIIPTGIKNMKENINVSIFPNPARDKVYIDLQDLDFRKNITFIIYDMQGHLLLQQDIMQDITELNIEAFPKGIYVLKLCNNNNVMTKKLVIR